MIDIKKTILIGSAIRIAILFDSFGPQLMSVWLKSEAFNSILNDPDYSLPYFREAVFVSHLSKDGVLKNEMQFHHYAGHPLLLTFVKFLLVMAPKRHQEFILCLCGVFLDFFIALMFYHFSKTFFEKRTRHDKFEEDIEQDMDSKIFPITKAQHFLFGLRFLSEDAPLVPANIPKVVSALYYLNPFTIFQNTCGIATLQSVFILMLLSTFHLCITGRSVPAGLILALLSHLDPYFIIFFIPCLLLWQRHREINVKPPPISLFIAPFLFGTALLNFISAILLGSGESLLNVYDLTRKLRVLRPSLGMQWYLFINMFHRVEEFFFVMSAGFLFLFSIPLLIRYSNYPIEIATMLVMMKTLFKPTPTIQDTIFSLCMAVLSPRSLARMGTYSVLALLALPVPMILYIVDYYLFLEVGNAPANYMFFQCLAYNLFLGIIFLDMFSATSKRDKALRITAIENKKKQK